MSGLSFLSALELAHKIRKKEISSRELLDHYLARVERLNPRINAVVTLDVEGARRRADAADLALARGGDLGLFHGVPMTVKDTIETAAIRTTAGYPPFADHVPANDAPIVARMVAAGAVVFGKTNNPVLAGDYQSFNPIFGTTNNPWNTGRTCGGSSGGSAAALAAGLTGFEIGSDIAGSIRVPAHWNGVYGHKPSHGIIPVRGHIPGPPGTLAEADLAVSGPMARSARDLGAALDGMAGPLPDRERAWRLELPPSRARELRDFRIAAWLDDAAYPVDPMVAGRLRATVDTLRAAGARIDESARPAFRMAEMVDVYMRLLWPIFGAGYPPEMFDALVSLASELPASDTSHVAHMARGVTLRHRDWMSANEAREHMRAAIADFFTRYDVLLMPVNQITALAHDQSEPQIMRTFEAAGARRPYFDLFAWPALAVTCLLPSTAAPVGLASDGMPVGLQIVGPYLEDRTTIAFAEIMEEVVGGFAPAPGFADA